MCCLHYSTVVQGGGVNLFDPDFKIRTVNVQKVIEVPRSRIKSLDNISLIFIAKRIHELSFVTVQKIGGNLFPSGFQQSVCITWFRI